MYRTPPAPFKTWTEYREARDAFYNSPEWLELRKKVIQKSDGRCVYCKKYPTATNPTNIDHRIPLCKRWDLRLTIGNLQVTCHKCNVLKSGMTHRQFLRKIRAPEYLRKLALSAKGKRKRRLMREIHAKERQQRASEKAKRDNATFWANYLK